MKTHERIREHLMDLNQPFTKKGHRFAGGGGGIELD